MDRNEDVKPLLLQLCTAPLGFQLDTPDGKRYFVNLSPTTAQSLVLALLAQPGIRGELTPELRAMIEEASAEYAKNDAEFLKAAGVASE